MKFRLSFFLVLLFFAFPVSPSRALSGNEAYQTGLAYYKNGQWDQSIVQFKVAIIFDPNSWLAYQMMGYAYTQEANASEAMDACMKSLKINPNNPTLWEFVQTTIKPHLYPSNPTESSSPTPITFIPIRDSFYVNLDGLSSLVTYSISQPPVETAIGVGYGFGIDKSLSMILDARFGNLSQYDWNYVTGYTLITIPTLTFLGNAKFNIVNGDNPVVFYGILGLGPSFYFGSYSQTYLALRFGLGLDIRLNPGLALTFEFDLVSPTSNPVYEFSSYGLKFEK
jgi:tetratricopeptide (TPR) repeat protein